MDLIKTAVGKHVSELPTPAFVVDKSKVEANCQRMLDRCRQLNVTLRPQTKTHKTLEGALIQKNGQKSGLVVSTLQEAELYADNGFDNILFGFPLIEHHLDRVFKLVEKLEQFHVMINNETSVQLLEVHSPPVNKKWSAFIKIDVGYKRAGIPWTESDRILKLANRISNHQNMKLEGLYVHCGNSYNKPKIEDVAQVRDESANRLLQLTDYLTKNGITCPTVGIGSTPSCSLELKDTQYILKLTEVHPGNYVFYDSQQESYGSCKMEDIAVRVVTRVISHFPERNQMLVDLGFTGLTKQGYNLLRIPGFGIIQNEPNLALMEMTQEIGKVEGINQHQIEFDKHPIGSVLYVYPYHACATAGLYSHYYIHDKDEKIIDVWTPVRGW